MSSFKKIIGRKTITLLYYIFRVFPIKRKKIFVQNFFGRGYGDSPKYIIKYLLDNYSGYDVVWSVKGEYEFPKGIRTVNNAGCLGVIKNIYEQTTAKVWIDNSRKHVFERKRCGQFYIQTWHGDIGVKKCEGDAIDKLPAKEVAWSKHDSKMADLFVCGNEWMRKRYREAYWYDGEIALCGLPRRDVLYWNDIYFVAEIKKSLGIEEKSKVLLYVPTFRREDVFDHHLGGYATEFDWEEALIAHEQKFGGKWVGLMRLHPNAAKYKNDLRLPNNVIDVTDYPDINEIFLVSDSCISDYSSALFEFAITKKPGFIYAMDKEKYENERGCYFTNEELPFTIASNKDELSSNIKMFDKNEYLKKHQQFYVNTIQMHPEGHASEYLAKRIVEVCEGSTL